MATATDKRWVLDTSVVLAWFLIDDRQHSKALEVLRDVRSDARAYVLPSLLFSELTHVLARRWSVADRVRSAVEAMLRFGVPAVPMTFPALLRMPHWACLGLGGYDATFVALAEDIDARWLTADARAAKVAGDRAVTLDRWRPR